MTSFSLKLDHKHCLHNTTVNVALDLVGTQLVSVECSLYPHLLSTRYLFSLISHFILFFCNNITLSEWTPKIMLSKIVLPTSSPFLLLPCFILRHSVYQLPGIGSVLLFLTFMQLYNVSSMRARTACAIVLYFPCPDWLTCQMLNIFIVIMKEVFIISIQRYYFIFIFLYYLYYLLFYVIILFLCGLKIIKNNFILIYRVNYFSQLIKKLLVSIS